MEKYGFVYIWRDRKHNRYYIGSHWGTEDDGYICSSRIMRQSYRRRPHDFKRKIIEVIHDDREELYEAENKWLKRAEKNKDRYYNIMFTTQHWSAYPDNVKTIREKISHRTKEAMQRPDVRKNYEEGIKHRDNKSSDPELKEKRRQSMIKTMAEKFPIEERSSYNRSENGSEIHKERLSTASTNMWANRTEDQLKEVGQKISEGLKGKKNRLGQTNSEEHRRKISEAQKGKIHPRHKISIDGVVYDSTVKAAEVLNISVPTINRRLKSNKYTEYYRLG